MESLADMPGFESYYEISDEGNARSKERLYRNKQGRLITKHSKNLKPILGDNGYVRFGLKVPEDDKVYKVLAHRMVALAFIPNTDNLPDVGHANNIRNINHRDNLYWTTKSDNIKKAVEEKNITSIPVVKANSCGVILKKDTEEKYFDSMTKMSQYLGCSVARISMAIKNKNKCCGYIVEKVYKPSEVIDMTSDVQDSSAITAKAVILRDTHGNTIVANSINSAADKLNRAASSVESALKNGTRCNGFHVDNYTMEFND